MSRKKFERKFKNNDVDDKKDVQSSGGGSNGNNSRSNRRHHNSKRKSKKTEVDISDANINAADLKGVTKSEENDGFWYSHYPELVNSFGSIPFSYPLGTKLPIHGITIDGKHIKPGFDYIPGIMTLGWYPVIGQASGYAADAVNQAANKIYVYVRHTLSTYANYDPSDMMMYILSMDTIYALYSELVRAYGVALNWKVLNKYYARAVLESLGFEPESILSNLAHFRGQINEIAYMLNQFVVPAGFDYITRHVWMASNLFYDGEAVKSQTYAYKMTGYYELTEVTDGPMYLKFVKKYPDTELLTATQAIESLKRCVSLVMNSQDCIAMSGDLLKAFGPSGTFVALPVQENYVIEPTYSKEVLSQIENATILGFPLVDESADEDKWNGDITQMTVLSAGPNIRQYLHILIPVNDVRYGAPLQMEWLLNFHKNDVSPLDVMIATRLTNIVESIGKKTNQGSGTTSAYMNFEALGSEVVSGCEVYYYKTEEASTPTLSKINLKGVGWGTSIPTISAWTMFDWAPRLIDISGPSTGSSPLEAFTYLDVDNYAILSKSDLMGLHSTAMLSLFEVPSIAKLAVKRFEPKSSK